MIPRALQAITIDGLLLLILSLLILVVRKNAPKPALEDPAFYIMAIGLTFSLLGTIGTVIKMIVTGG